MPQWLCGWDGCGKPAAQIAGDCLLCDQHLCRAHRQEPWHKCPKPEVSDNTSLYSPKNVHSRGSSANGCRHRTTGKPTVLNMQPRRLVTLMSSAVGLMAPSYVAVRRC